MNDVADHHDSDKPRYSLLPRRALAEVVFVMEHGAAKYAPNNYLLGNGLDPGRLWDSAQRHLWAIHTEDEMLDGESALSHWAHAAADCLMALEVIKKRTQATTGESDDLARQR